MALSTIFTDKTETAYQDRFSSLDTKTGNLSVPSNFKHPYFLKKKEKLTPEKESAKRFGDDRYNLFFARNNAWQKNAVVNNA